MVRTIRKPRAIRHTLSHCLVLAGTILALAGTASAQGTADARDDDLFAKGAWHLELGPHYAIETWNYNISHENMAGGTAGVTYGLRKGLALVLTAPLYYIEQRGPDAWLLGTTWGVRWRAVEGRRASLFLEFEVGISKADVYSPPRGTRFNYLALGAAGVATRLAKGTHLLAGIKWAHVSNASLAGRSRNPDIEAVGPRISVLTRF